MIDYPTAGFASLQGTHLYVPGDQGIYDILIANGKITAVVNSIPSDIISDCIVVNLDERILRPGFIDQRIRLTGGSGEVSPMTHTPEVTLGRLTGASVTPVIGLLGTDSISRHSKSPFAKTRAPNGEDISAQILTDAYHVPSHTIAGSVERDMAVIDRVIGMECIISDHRSITSDVYHLTNIAAESCVDGLFGDKPGITALHMGDSKRTLQPIYDLPESCDVPISKLLPTHINRDAPLLKQTLEFACKGGIIDITSSIDEPVTPAEGIARAVQAGIPLAYVTLSSNGNSSQPFFDNEGNLTRIDIVGLETLLETAQVLIEDYDFSINDTLYPLASSVAGFLNLTEKGGTLPGNDIDLLVMAPELRIEQVYARGRLMVRDGKTYVKGVFETA